ncbi:MAG TPA: hypothetical protein VN606_04660 [Thermoleophilaceae bacterium]|jgi:hypothetical protein|nr:hypothetical protein [Thermoleophilaceae bacterium]
MTTRKYTMTGWLVWKLASLIAKWKLGRINRAKLGAGAAVALVLLGGVVAAKSGNGDD